MLDGLLDIVIGDINETTNVGLVVLDDAFVNREDVHRENQ